MFKNFISKSSKDKISITLINDAHKAIYNIKVVDYASDHVALFKEVYKYMHEQDVKWVEIPTSFKPIVPTNTLYYKDKFNDNIICHIIDFEKFYWINIDKFIKLNNIYISQTDEDNEGWINVVDSKKEKKKKLESLIRDIQLITNDWNNL